MCRLIVRVRGVLGRTVVNGCDKSLLDNLCGSHHQKSRMTSTQVIKTSVTSTNCRQSIQTITPHECPFKQFLSKEISMLFKSAFQSLNFKF